MSRAHLTLLLLLSLAPIATACRQSVIQEYLEVRGFVEPHTPGSGAPQALLPSDKLAKLLGPEIDLNRVSYGRTAYARSREQPERPRRPRGPRPAIVLILVPGLPAGAASVDPLARGLVTAFRGKLEVWTVDRRPNQLEDRLGAVHARGGASRGEFEALAEGAQFYFADIDLAPLGNFPGLEDLDVDLDGVLDRHSAGRTGRS